MCTSSDLCARPSGRTIARRHSRSKCSWKPPWQRSAARASSRSKRAQASRRAAVVAGEQGELGQGVDHERQAVDDLGVVLDPSVLFEDPEAAAVLAIPETLEELQTGADEALELARMPAEARREGEGEDAAALAEERLLRLAARPAVLVVGGAEAAVLRLQDALHPERQQPVAEVRFGGGQGLLEPGPQAVARHGHLPGAARAGGANGRRESPPRPRAPLYRMRGLGASRRPVAAGGVPPADERVLPLRTNGTSVSENVRISGSL